MMKPLSVVDAPLDGNQLIEAGAGTGKTYTISSLVVRLILEKKLAIHQILVVTYTRAATEELKMRIWRRLQEVRRAMGQKDHSTDAFVDAIVLRAQDDPNASGRIGAALADFDRAAIFTIHGFCQRVLQEHAFETGSPYEINLVTDPNAIIQEIAEDFWRLNLYSASAEFIAYASSKKRISSPQFFADFWSLLPPPPFQILPGPEISKSSRLKPYRQMIRQLRRQWRDEKDAIVGLLQHASLNGRIYGALKPVAPDSPHTAREAVVATLAEAMTRFLADAAVAFPLFAGFEKFTSSRLAQAATKSKSPPMHPFFDACEEAARMADDLQKEFDTHIRRLNAAFADFAQRRLAVLKKSDNIIFYDDLLTVVRDGLYGKNRKNSDRLIYFLKQKYKAALVDEFQDTDPIQYDIFKALFGTDGSLFCMIGDPKQSIYSFRGADIFAYMNAAGTADGRHTLVHNWRSHPRLIRAVNTLFGNTDQPFIYDQIPFRASRPGAIDGNRHPKISGGLRFWYLLDDRERKLAKSEAVGRILEAVAGETARLAFGPQPVASPDEIAVLVRTNRQAGMMKDVFSRHGIPSVIHSTGNVFDSPEAADLKRILMAILEPAHERRLRAALVSNPLGVDSRRLLVDHELQNDALENHRRAFQQFQGIWRSEGLMAMFGRLMTEYGVRSRLLGQPDGERRLTNLLHLMEILHESADRGKLNPYSLVRWLSERINRQWPQDEAHLLRLEKDAAAVSIVTIHKSKGLEYPVVLCPFVWEGIFKPSGGTVVYHDDAFEGRKVVDLGSPEHDASLAKAAIEAAAENLRLLYVAATRARIRCYLVWGRINTAETSALAYLLHPEARAHRAADPLKALKSHMETLDSHAYRQAIEALADRSEGAISAMPLPTESTISVETREPGQAGLSRRQLRRRPTNRWNIASYSSLVTLRTGETAGHRDELWHTAAAARLRSSDDGPTDPIQEGRDLFAFPRGAAAGLFFHDLLEHLDFSEPSGDARRRLIASKLTAHGLDLQWQEPIDEMIDHLTTVSLGSDNAGPVLAAVSRARRISEMAFTFALKPLQLQQLRSALAVDVPGRLPAAFLERMQRLPHTNLQGFMRGYIDLVFKQNQRYYLVDWKSNYLGPRLQDYHRDALQGVMSDDAYFLQAYLYALALNRYLRQVDPTYRYRKNFGGIFYIFIRGLDAGKGPQFGIVDVNPSCEVIEGLEKLMLPDPDLHGVPGPSASTAI